MQQTRAKPVLALVVKYYHPSRRISGILNFLDALAGPLAARFDLHVISSRRSSEEAPTSSFRGYTLHKVGWPFPLMAGRKASGLRANVVLVVSGIYDLQLAVPYFSLLNLGLRTTAPCFFYQATNVRDRPTRLLARVLRRYQRVLCCNPVTLQAFDEVIPGRSHLFYPAVDTLKLEEVQPAPKPGFRFGFVNHFHPVKGADTALRIFEELARELEGVDFVVAGEGPLGAELRGRYGRTAGIHFHGYLEEGERLSLMRSCDVMLCPFRTEVSILGISQAVLECMAMGVVVVGTDVPAISAAIRSGEDGFLASGREELAARLRSLERDRELLLRLSRSARERARNVFDVARAAESLTRHLGGEDHRAQPRI